MASDGKLVAYEIDLAQELFRRMHAGCEIVVQDWGGMLPVPKAGKFDAIIASTGVIPCMSSICRSVIQSGQAPH